jgi:hypothetical protein
MKRACFLASNLIVTEVFVRDNRDVFDDGTAQQLTPQEIQEVRAAMSSKVDSFQGCLLNTGYYFDDICK